MSAQPVEMFPGQREQAKRREMAERMQTEALRIACMDTIAECVEAMRAPNICRHNIENAMRSLPRAYAAACVLDPEDDKEPF